MSLLAHLPDRGVIAVSGEDRVSFLQGLVSNDVAQVAPGRAVWAALLTPQGKWLADFFMLADRDRLLLDCERGHIPMLLPRLKRYRLRARIGLEESPDLQVYVAWDGMPPVPPDVICAPDPRLSGAGFRVIAAAPMETDADAAAWDAHRLALGLPDGSRDLDPDKTVLLEAGFDELRGVSWSKGCYMGQELTARTKYRGLIKRRLMPVSIQGTPPSPGTPVMRDGVEVGTMRSSRDMIGLATLRLDALADRLACGEAILQPRPPQWMAAPAAAN